MLPDRMGGMSRVLPGESIMMDMVVRTISLQLYIMCDMYMYVVSLFVLFLLQWGKRI